MTVRITVLFFSVLRDLTGSDRVVLELTAGDGLLSLSDLLSTLYTSYPGLESWDNRLLLAVNAEFATRAMSIQNGDEVALMPPVQGG